MRCIDIGGVYYREAALLERMSEALLEHLDLRMPVGATDRAVIRVIQGTKSPAFYVRTLRLAIKRVRETEPPVTAVRPEDIVAKFPLD